MGSYAKKINYLFIAAALLGSGVASAEFDLKGSGRFRIDSKDNADYSSAAEDKADAYGMRYRLDFKFTPNENVSVFFQPQFVKTTDTTSSQLSNTGLDVHQAYMDLKAGDNTVVTMGRKEMIYGDHLLVGSVGWSDQARAFDLVKVRHNHNMGWADVFTSTVYNGTPGDDRYFSGLYNGLSFDMIKAVDVYYLQYLRPLGTAVAANESISTAGVRLKHDYGALDYRFEFASQTFTQTGLEAASLADLEVGYVLSDNYRFAFEYSSATKDYNQLFPTAHKWLGIADFYARKNITQIRVGASGNVAKWGIGLDYHMFSRTDDSAGAYNFGGTSLGTVGTDTAIASEIDLTFKRVINDAYTVKFGLATVTPGDYLKAQGFADAGNYFFVQTSANF